MIEVKEFLKKKFKTEVIENKTKQGEWLTWYKNNNAWRTYKVMLPNKKRTKKDVTRSTLNSCKRVCEDWANLLLNEKTDIVVNMLAKQIETKVDTNTTEEDTNKVKADTYNDLLHDVLVKNDFWTFGNKAIEKVFALGGGAFVVGKNDDDEINIEFVDATRCYVMKCNADEVIDCAFENTITLRGKKHTILNVHIQNEQKTYTIYNYLFDDDGNALSENEMKELLNVEAEVVSNTKTFSFITPQNLSAENWDTPFADSVYAKAIDANKMIDLAFDSYCNEYILGKKRIFVASELMTFERETTANGKTVAVPVFDENEVVFNILPENSNDETIIKEVNMDLRTEAHQTGIQDALNFFASLCGLGEKYYKYEQGNITTATQVVSENSTLFRNIQKQQIPIERCLKEICFAIFGLLEIDTSLIEDIVITFDDSIIQDKEAERKQDMSDVNNGIMSKAEYRAKWYGETLEVAQKTIDAIEGKEIENEMKRQQTQGILI